jgi:hypothetical protein
MKSLLLAVVVGMLATSASATCTSDATAKKLSGAAQTSFMTKCENDAKARCDQTATTNHLSGAARTSNVNKCTKDAVGG